jgi:ribose-phosphate pyrophosphokinase
MDGLAVPAHGFKLLSGTGNRPLAEEIGRQLGIPLTKVTCNRFADGEIFVRIDENVRGNDVFIVQSTNAPAENIMELLLLIDASRRASAARITVVMPYYGYSRQDRKDQPRVAIGAKLVANMIMSAGADRLLGIDFHQHQLQGFFDIPVDHLYAMPVLTAHFRKKQLKDTVIVAPDVGSAKMARGFAKRLDASLAIIDKRRPRANESEVMNIIGEVEGKSCVLVDDLVDTAGTLCHAAKALKEVGASRVVAYITHAVLSGPAVERIEGSDLDELVCTDTIPLRDAARKSRKIRQLSVAGLLAETMRRIRDEESVSSLYID